MAELEVEAETLGGLLGTLAARMPALAELIVVDRPPPHDAKSASRGARPPLRLHSSLAANLNGDRFISDPATPLKDGDRVLILSSDVGG